MKLTPKQTACLLSLMSHSRIDIALKEEGTYCKRDEGSQVFDEKEADKARRGLQIINRWIEENLN